MRASNAPAKLTTMRSFIRFMGSKLENGEMANDVSGPKRRSKELARFLIATSLMGEVYARFFLNHL